MRILNKLAKWRTIFAGWQLGTRSTNDPECNAVKDHRETTILLRAEASALVGLLVMKGLITSEEFTVALIHEAELLSKDYERRFPGMRATDDGIEIFDIPAVDKWMKAEHWKP